MKTDQRGVKYSCDSHSKQERNSYPRGCVHPSVVIDTSFPSVWGLPSHTHDFLGCCISPRLLVVEARLRLWRTRKLPLIGLAALEDDELPLRGLNIKKFCCDKIVFDQPGCSRCWSYGQWSQSATCTWLLRMLAWPRRENRRVESLEHALVA